MVRSYASAGLRLNRQVMECAQLTGYTAGSWWKIGGFEEYSEVVPKAALIAYAGGMRRQVYRQLRQPMPH